MHEGDVSESVNGDRSHGMTEEVDGGRVDGQMRFKRPKGIKTRPREAIDTKQVERVVHILSGMKDQLKRSTGVIQAVVDGQAEGR